MNILIVGKGWVGTRVYYDLLTRRRENVIQVHRLYHKRHTQVWDFLNENHQLDWVINCAGVTGVPNVDACELDKANTLYGNAVFPVKLAYECLRRGIRFAHFSSGCIYEGEITDVNATPNFFGSTYSISKGISDVALADIAQVYRIRMPFSDMNEPKNYLVKVRNYATNGKLFDGGLNSLTHIDEAVRIACNLVERNAPNGRYNLVNKGAVALQQIVDMFELSAKWFTESEFRSVTACARSNCVIPPYHEMSDVVPAIEKAIRQLKDQDLTHDSVCLT